MLRTPIVLVTATSLTLAACSVPPDGGDPNANRTRDGAIAGAVIGGLLGLSQGREFKNVAIGATAGGIVGAGIGSVLDRQAADLRAALGNDQVGIVNTGSELIVTMPQDILFDVDSTMVKPAVRADLATLADNLQRYPDNTVQVIGHTDWDGPATYNLNLSRRRAAAVSAILSQNGVPSGRLQAFGRGEDEPIATNLTPEGRAQNRRVEIIIRPNAG